MTNARRSIGASHLGPGELYTSRPTAPSSRPALSRNSLRSGTDRREPLVYPAGLHMGLGSAMVALASVALWLAVWGSVRRGSGWIAGCMGGLCLLPRVRGCAEGYRCLADFGLIHPMRRCRGSAVDRGSWFVVSAVS